MLKSVIVGLLFAGVLAFGVDKDPKNQNWKPTPLMRTVEPDTAKAGDVVTVSGENLDKARVASVYFTDGKSEVKLVVVEQTEKTVKVKVPDNTKPGRLRLMVLTTGAEPQYLEQPVTVVIE